MGLTTLLLGNSSFCSGLSPLAETTPYLLSPVSLTVMEISSIREVHVYYVQPSWQIQTKHSSEIMTYIQTAVKFISLVAITEILTVSRSRSQCLEWLTCFNCVLEKAYH